MFVGPFVPDRDAVFLQVADIGIALQEPQKFVDDGTQVALLGGDEREAVGEVVARLPAEHRQGAGAGAVVFAGAMFEHMAHQVEIGFHRGVDSGFCGCGLDRGIIVQSGFAGHTRVKAGQPGGGGLAIDVPEGDLEIGIGL